MGNLNTQMLDRYRSDFLAEVEANVEEGEWVKMCMQCGVCSGSCPFGPHWEHPPQKLFMMIRAGQREAVLSSDSMWLCTSCYRFSERGFGFIHDRPVQGPSSRARVGNLSRGLRVGWTLRVSLKRARSVPGCTRRARTRSQDGSLPESDRCRTGRNRKTPVSFMVGNPPP